MADRTPPPGGGQPVRIGETGVFVQNTGRTSLDDSPLLGFNRSRAFEALRAGQPDSNPIVRSADEQVPGSTDVRRDSDDRAPTTRERRNTPVQYIPQRGSGAFETTSDLPVVGGPSVVADEAPQQQSPALARPTTLERIRLGLRSPTDAPSNVVGQVNVAALRLGFPAFVSGNIAI